MKAGKPEAVRNQRPTDAKVRAILAALDDQGRWISTYAGERLVGQPPFKPGFRYLSSAVFAQNLERLSEYLKP